MFKLFLALEKHNYDYKNISQLLVENELVQDKKEILNEIKLFYENLYSEKKFFSSEEQQLFINQNCKTLSNEEAELCEGTLMLSECTKVLNKLSSGKTPGSDSLTVEFYRLFWEDINQTISIRKSKLCFFKTIN